MKKHRQEKIRELISIFEIGTQDDLIGKLREFNYDVTQATISRDIREMKISKMLTKNGSYRYVLPAIKDSGDPSNMFHFSATIINAIIHVDHACNIVVLKTHAGLAQAVAVGIDAMDSPEVLGCVAGDDTIMIVSRNEESAVKISANICSMLKQG